MEDQPVSLISIGWVEPSLAPEVVFTRRVTSYRPLAGSTLFSVRLQTAPLR